MIISRKKPFEEIAEALRDDKSIVILGCGECATATRTGGEPEVEEMKAKLEELGKKVIYTAIIHTGCHELDVKRHLRQAKEGYDAVLVLSCGAGTQAARASTEKHVVPGTDPLFLGNIQRSMDFAEKCSHCGACIIDDYGAICPVTRCAKGLLHGPCGGTSHGKCEVDPEMDCAWTLIYNQLKKEGRLDKMKKLHEPKSWNVIRRPGTVVDRGPEKQKMGAEQ